MCPLRRIRTAVVAGCMAAMFWAPTASSATPVVPADPESLLAQADRIKTSDHALFVAILHRLDADQEGLSRRQQDLLHYFHGWESAYEIDNDTAIRTLRAVASQASDPDLRLRATSSLINVLVEKASYEEAYQMQEGLIAGLPGVRNPKLKLRIYANASLLYSNAGQDDLALHYADQMLAESDGDFATCEAQYLRTLAFSYTHDQAFENNYPVVLAACQKAGEPLFTSGIRVLAAERDNDQGHPDKARATLQPFMAEISGTQFPQLLSEADAAIASALWKQGDGNAARELARKSIGLKATEKTLSMAYQVLYEIAKKDGDMAGALDWHEKFAAASRGYLDDINAHAIAYQMVRQQVLQKKAQIDALSQQNQVLKLKQSVNRKNMIAVELSIALLIVVLGSIAMYAYRTKRSQLKFQKLAQRDGLTGIFNRQHFIEASEQALDYGARSVRDACLIAIDLDHFKDINDEHGHAAGDTAIKRVVAACQLHLRSVDVFGRVGGEEFGILMPDCVPERAADMAEEMRKAVCEMSGFEDGPDIPVSASFGIAAARWSGYDLRQLLAHADSALYEAKRAGRNRVVLHREHAPGAGSNLPPGAVDRRRG